MIDDLMDWISDHKIGCAAIAIVFMLIMISGVVVYATASVQDDTPTPTPTPIPTVTVEPTFTPTPTPEPFKPVNESTGETMAFDEYMEWMAEYYYNTSTTTTRPNGTPIFLDPLLYSDFLKWKNATHYGEVSPNNPDYVPGHPETANGSLVFVPTPIPCPTPTPAPSVDPWSREVHQAQPNIALPPPDKEGNEPGILAWDAEHTRGLYPYYTPGDHAVVQLRFVNNYYYKDMVNPTVYIVVKKQVLGEYIEVSSISWIEKVTIPGVQVDQLEGHPINAYEGFNTTVYEFDIPDRYKFSGFSLDSSGNYIMEVSIYVDNVRACWISKMFTIV